MAKASKSSKKPNFGFGKPKGKVSKEELKEMKKGKK
jgi:hypothetical protein